MPRGGSRPGAGRKAGSTNKRSQEVVERAKAAGMLPHEFLCAVSQGQEIDGYTPTFAERLAAARDAAPHYAPKLATVAHTGKDGGPMQHEVNDLAAAAERRARVRAELAQAFGIDFDAPAEAGA